MTLPEPTSGFQKLPAGKFIFKILDPPLKKGGFGPEKNKTGIELNLYLISEEDGRTHEGTLLLFPGMPAYRTLKEEIVKSVEEVDWVGKSFRAELTVEPNPKNPGGTISELINIEPMQKKAEDTTPPPEETGNPGPSEEEDPYPEKDEEEPPF